MPRLVAAVVLAVFTFMIGADSVCCPDGCTNGAQTTGDVQHTAADGTCVICVGGMGASLSPVFDCSVVLSQCIAVADAVSPDDVPPAALDHPPRG